jgi:glycosyltransferase involved in cell wall biosynthesis
MAESKSNPMKIVFFIESLHTGGTQRRLLELIGFLKQYTDFEMVLVLTEADIHFQKVDELGIKIEVLQRQRTKYDPRLFITFYRFCRSARPTVIHSWGMMTTFYAIPTKLMCRIPLITNMIADAKKNFKKYSLKNLFFYCNTIFSDVILANSKAGLEAYQISSRKSKVIYNGVRSDRFRQDFDSKKIRKEIGVEAPYVIIMLASFSKFKDYDLFLDVAKRVREIRNDTKFIGVGDGDTWKRIHRRICEEKIDNVLLTGKQQEVERFIAASDIGLLCTYSEGISNSIIEYMSLGKPVICTDITGGSVEIVVEGETGFCMERDVEKVAIKIDFLLKQEKLRKSMGIKGQERINSHFSLERFGNEFKLVYEGVIVRENR